MTRDFRSKGLVLNIDINSEVIPFFSSVVQDKDITEESFYPFVDQYIDVSWPLISSASILRWTARYSRIITRSGDAGLKTAFR